MLAGPGALRRRADRKRMELEATRLSHDPEYLAEIARVQADLHGGPSQDQHAAG